MFKKPFRIFFFLRNFYATTFFFELIDGNECFIFIRYKPKKTNQRVFNFFSFFLLSECVILRLYFHSFHVTRVAHIIKIYNAYRDHAILFLLPHFFLKKKIISFVFRLCVCVYCLFQTTTILIGYCHNQ